MLHPRQNNSIAIGHMYHSNPTVGEKYYVRLLLTAVKGPQSFKHLRTVNGIRYRTFCETCIALGLTRDDEQWVKTFQKVATFASRQTLRELFITAMIFDLGDAQKIWERFRTDFCDDLEYCMH